MKATTELIVQGFKEGQKDGKPWKYMEVMTEEGSKMNLFGNIDNYKDSKIGEKRLVELNIIRYIDAETKLPKWSVKVC